MVSKPTSQQKRFYSWVGIIITLSFVVIAARMVQLQLVERDIHQKEMKRRLTGSSMEIARRGKILDINGRLMATSVSVDSCALDPELMRRAIERLIKAKREPEDKADRASALPSRQGASNGDGVLSVFLAGERAKSPSMAVNDKTSGPGSEFGEEVREWMDKKLIRLTTLLEMNDEAAVRVRMKARGEKVSVDTQQSKPTRFIWLQRGMSAAQTTTLRRAMSGARTSAAEAWTMRKKWQKVAQSYKRHGDRDGEARALAAAQGWRLVALEWEASFAGVHFPPDYGRSYPQGRLAAHVLGFTRPNSHGHEGAEKRYDPILTGSPIVRPMFRDARRRGLSTIVSDNRTTEGMTVVLNIDTTIQSFVEEELERVVKSLVSESPDVYANVVVMDPYTGAVLALANYPTFDPNAPYPVVPRNHRNDAVVGVQEPGSIFKPLLIAAALEEGVVRLDEDWNCTTLHMNVGQSKLRKISDPRPYGRMPLLMALAKSSNPAMVRVGERLGSERLRRYILAFGFGERSGGDFPGESRGRVISEDAWNADAMGSVPMGYGINVTTLQMACAYSVIANGGLLPRPRLLAEIRGGAGEKAFAYPPHMRRRVISEETAAKVRQALRTVVAEGTGRRANISEYQLGGKTGTANMVLNEEEKRALGKKVGYSSTRHTANFVALAPWDAPRVVICVSIRDTRKFGGEAAAPTAAAIAKRILSYLGVPMESIIK